MIVESGNGDAALETFHEDGVGVGTSIPYATSVSSPAVRLVELDAMKGMLSDEEYEKKREEIISSV